ncbi:aminoglycoside phosphotransferase family protein [Rhizobium mongolense]|uniref:Aminoglycoside phosphotransferase (APT) family kinase protein n=1 Tax=Rhizobium mongolense TaxID=57676 RepID=A0A7W6RUL4_9HYPH|nr:aminoglycoside phosphotransferase family protein [Rhizobium mongolense]MBB4278250.1 aminoglycoside phosphotransferase (APT) family kinase protein [Rhizobium mongolense]
MSSTDIGDLLGTGKEAEVYEHGALVLKLYRVTASKSAAFREAAVLALIEPFGLPAPKVSDVRQHGDRWGLVMTRACGQPFADAMISQPALIPKYLDEMVRLHRQIHRQSGHALPGLKARLASNIRHAPSLNTAHRERLLRGLDTLPNGNVLCHGDFHPWNILGSPGQAMVVDWLDACAGNPSADVCRTYVLIRHAEPEIAACYVETYARAGGLALGDIFAWLPFVAAARLAEGVSKEEDELIRMADAGWSDI